MGIFDGMRESKIFDTGAYLSDGDYVLEIQNTIIKNTQNSGDGFIAEVKVVESSEPAKHPVGAVRGWFQSMTKKTIALPEIKKFIYAAYGYDLKRDAERIKREIEPHVESLASDAVQKNALKGVQIRCHVFTKKTKEKQVDFSVHQFSPLRDTPPAVPG